MSTRLKNQQKDAEQVEYILETPIMLFRGNLIGKAKLLYRKRPLAIKDGWDRPAPRIVEPETRRSRTLRRFLHERTFYQRSYMAHKSMLVWPLLRV